MSDSPKKLKVLHITAMWPTKEKIRSGTFVKNQVDSLRGYVDLDVLHISGGKGFGKYIARRNKIMASLKKDYDIIHIHYGNLASFIKTFFRYNKAIITSYCGDDLLGSFKNGNEYKIKSRVMAQWNIAMARRDDHSITKSEELANKVRTTAGHIDVIPNGVDIDQFNVKNKKNCREQIGIPEDGKPLILFPSDPEDPRKNFQLLEEALKGNSPNDYHVVSFGGKGVSHTLVPVYMNAADLVVYPSLHEGSPNAVKEAMACNCRVWTTPCGDTEWLLAGAESCKVLPYDKQDWIKEMHTFLADFPNNEESSARQTLIEKKLDLDAVAQKICNIYNNVLKRRNDSLTASDQ